jgi:hypothetical protein
LNQLKYNLSVQIFSQHCNKNGFVVDFIICLLFFLSVDVGGETAEMPGTYQSGHFEVSGFVVGAVERAQYLPRSSEILPGDVVIGIPSTGIHSNGFSLVRALVSQCQLTYDLPCPFETGKSLGMFAASFKIWPTLLCVFWNISFFCTWCSVHCTVF